MAPVASISRRLVRIAGEPNSGWSGADPDDLNATEIEFAFSVTSDGNANYLLVYQSADGRYSADSWHETVEEAIACAQESFDVQPSEWAKPEEGQQTGT